MRADVQRRWGQVVSTFFRSGGALAVVLAPLACRVSEADVHRWSSTLHGPDKLEAVVTHDKYDVPLRVEAGLELIRMKPRGGRRIGINLVGDALASLPPDDRKKVLDGMLPVMIDEIKKPPPGPQAVDESMPYKDALFAILSYDRAVLIPDDAQRKSATDALFDWSNKDFERRLDNSTQMFGMEQMFRFIGPSAVRGLPALITVDSAKFDRIASLVSEIGDQATKEAAATKLVELARYTASPAWTKKVIPALDEANQKAGQKVAADRVAKQAAQYQDETLVRIFGALKKIGTRPAVEYSLQVAADKAQSDPRRTAALAALEGRLDRNNPLDVERVLSIATADDTSDSVRDIAFQRVGEMSREQVVARLYALFGHKKWKVRWVSAGLVLKMSNTAQVPEFMSKLPVGAAPGFGMSEPLSYGSYIDRMQVKDNKSPKDAVSPYLREGSLAQKLTALGYFYAAGKPADMRYVAPLENDKTLVPKTDDQDAKWQCDVPNGKDTETKEIKDVGEFVRFCVEPAMKGRT